MTIFNEEEWERKREQAAQKHPLKVLKTLPKMAGMTPETARFFKWKALYWMIKKDKGLRILRGFLKRPFTHAHRFLRSFFSEQSFKREGDLFLYGLSSITAFEEALKEPQNILLLGFSYCHKPFECPSGRFTDQCINAPDHPVCQQCFIGKALQIAPKTRCVPLFIPTVHYIGEKVIEALNRYPNNQILFLITACEMTLNMFGDYGNMAGIRGIGIRLDGRICNTMDAFALSEEGIKPGLTVVLPETQTKILDFLKIFHVSVN